MWAKGRINSLRQRLTSVEVASVDRYTNLMLRAGYVLILLIGVLATPEFIWQCHLHSGQIQHLDPCLDDEPVHGPAVHSTTFTPVSHLDTMLDTFSSTVRLVGVLLIVLDLTVKESMYHPPTPPPRSLLNPNT